MTLKTRRILSLVFIISFAIITPLIMLYAAGYKLRKNIFSIERTGQFIIETKPKGAKVFINGQTQKTLTSYLFNQNNLITTPAKIKNLLPGEYDLTLKLEGYSDWSKKLIINPSASTFVKDVYLFRNNPPSQITSMSGQTISFSPLKNQALTISSDQLKLLNLINGKTETLKQTGTKLADLAWSTDGQSLVVNGDLYKTSDLNSKIDLNNLTPGIFNYKWYDNILFYQDKTSLYQLTSENFPKKIINNLGFDDYLVKDNYLYLISQQAKNSVLEVVNSASGEKIQSVSLPATARYAFINPEQDLINLYDLDHEILYLINPSITTYQPLVEIINNLKTAFWYDSHNLLYTNDFEIWLYNLESRKKTLITRLSHGITNAVMHPSKKYIIYATNQTLNAIELDARAKRNTVELAKLSSIYSFIINSAGDVIYLAGKIDNNEGLYKLLIQ